MHECRLTSPGQSFALLAKSRSSSNLPRARLNDCAAFIDSYYAGEPPSWLFLPTNEDSLALGVFQNLDRRLNGYMEAHRAKKREPGQVWPPRQGGYWSPFPLQWRDLTNKAEQDDYWKQPIREAKQWPLLVILGAAPSLTLSELLKARLARWTIITASLDDLENLSEFYDRNRSK